MTVKWIVQVHVRAPGGPASCQHLFSKWALALQANVLLRCPAPCRALTQLPRRRRQPAHVSMRRAGARVCGHRAERGAGHGAVWVPARGVPAGRAAARRPRIRPGPLGDAAGRRCQHPRRHRIPQNCAGMFAVGHAVSKYTPYLRAGLSRLVGPHKVLYVKYCEQSDAAGPRSKHSRCPCDALKLHRGMPGP